MMQSQIVEHDKIRWKEGLYRLSFITLIYQSDK